MSSRKAAIDNFCKACICDPQPGNGTWRQQTENCSNSRCPLFPFRPLAVKTLPNALTLKESRQLPEKAAIRQGGK